MFRVFRSDWYDKKIQQEVIDLIKNNLDKYKDVIEKLVKN